MGYRSDVAYKIWFDDEQVRDACIDLVLANGSEWMIKALKACEIGREKRYGTDIPLGVLSFQAEDVKWYDEYDDVEGHTSLIRFATTHLEDSCGAYMVRMGEHDDDVEHDEWGNSELVDNDAIYVSRALEVGDVDEAQTYDEWVNKTTTKQAA